MIAEFFMGMALMGLACLIAHFATARSRKHKIENEVLEEIFVELVGEDDPRSEFFYMARHPRTKIMLLKAMVSGQEEPYDGL